ncbi:hypothetical protein ACFFR3_31575 [Nonomuraea salmonea]|uniref:Uncharacterized protein n=1 Tax=Nonomuraea salmonea TaxID=46181 RepID=A0ABV5NUT6_9ACTN
MSTSAGDGGEVARLWGIVTHIVTPTTLVAAIMMYFGAVRANTMYAQFGVDQSMLGLSFQDYVLRSVTLAVEPLVLVLVVVLIAPPVHAWLTRAAGRHRTAAMWGLAVAAAVGAAGTVTGLLGLAGWAVLPRYFLPLCLGAGIIILVYAESLYGRLNGHTTPATRGVVRRAACGALLLLLLLWSVTEYAQRKGWEAAVAYRADTGMLPSTVVYAARRLFLEGPGITETTLPDQNAMFRYRYTGLRLLIHSNQRYFLLPACWATSPWARAIALPADGSLRLEFHVLKMAPPECPPGQ